jgi:uncharacterized protein (DUF1800 family)
MQVKGYSPNAVDKAQLAKRNGHLDADRSAQASKVRERTSQPDAVQLSKVGASITDKTEKADIAGDRQPAIADRQRAQAFAQKVPAEAIMDHPELAGSYAAMVSMKKKAAADGLSPQQRAVVIARVEANLVNSIERGELPKVKVREQVEVRHQRKADRKVTR